MITHRETTTEPQAAATLPRLWGLSAKRLHEAYWHARGVQVVARGERATLQRAAELYLLAEADQMVLFRLAPLSERLTWRNARVTRLRLIDRHNDPYHERVMLDDRGSVCRIERRYTPTLYGSYRIVLTPSRRIASLWMQASTRREAWDRVRRSVPWSQIDHWRCDGRAFRAGESAQEHAFLDELVGVWPRPDQAVDGIEEAEDGVWRLPGEPLGGDTVRVGPLWIGRGGGTASRPCLVGPHWIDDVQDGDGPAATVREIDDVEPADEAVAAVARGGHVYHAIKRGMDIAVSATALIVALPIMAFLALAVLIDTGRPIFYAQEREGRAGRPFPCWKFRSMFTNAEEVLRQYLEDNKCDGPQVNIENDPRVTRVGRVLRATHLDELPQLWNVLVGQMSIVGPRPSPYVENQFCPAWRDARLSVRPGITGLWQLKRKRKQGEDFQEWIKYDIDYVQRASLWLDLTIVVRTAVMLIRGRSNGAPK